MQHRLSQAICNSGGAPGLATRRGIPVTRHVSSDFVRPLGSHQIRVSPRCAASEDSFNRLGVAPDSPKDVIRKAYRKLVLRVHPDLHPDGNDQEFIQVHEAYETLIANKGKPKPKPINGQETWNFHDWHWKCRMSRAFDKQHHKEGTVNPYSSTERMQPAHKDQVRSQLQGLQRKARYRKGRKTDSSVPASWHRQQAEEDPAQQSADSASHRRPSQPHQETTARSQRARIDPASASDAGSGHHSSDSPPTHHESRVKHAAAAHPGVDSRMEVPISQDQVVAVAAGNTVSKAAPADSFPDASCSTTYATDDRGGEAPAPDWKPAAPGDSGHVAGQTVSENEEGLSPADVGSFPHPSRIISYAPDNSSHIDVADESLLPQSSHSSARHQAGSRNNAEAEISAWPGSHNPRRHEETADTARQRDLGSEQLLHHQFNLSTDAEDGNLRIRCDERVPAGTAQQRDLGSTQLLHCQPDSPRDAESGEAQSVCDDSSSASDSEDEAQIGYQGSSRVRSQLAGLRRKHRLYSS